MQIPNRKEGEKRKSKIDSDSEGASEAKADAHCLREW
jgi:hypothetical protein